MNICFIESFSSALNLFRSYLLDFHFDCHLTEEEVDPSHTDTYILYNLRVGKVLFRKCYLLFYDHFT